jgi:hypothetical protein
MVSFLTWGSDLFPVPSPDLTAKRNDDVKSSHNCIPFIHIQYLRDYPLCAGAQRVPLSGPPTENCNFLQHTSNDLVSPSVIYENHLPKEVLNRWYLEKNISMPLLAQTQNVSFLENGLSWTKGSFIH